MLSYIQRLKLSIKLTCALNQRNQIGIIYVKAPVDLSGFDDHVNHELTVFHYDDNEDEFGCPEKVGLTKINLDWWQDTAEKLGMSLEDHLLRKESIDTLLSNQKQAVNNYRKNGLPK